MSDGARTPPDAMTPERWARLAPLVDAALDLDPARRGEYVASLASTNPGLAASLERLIADRDDALLMRAAAAREALLASHDPAYDADVRAILERALGATYRIERELEGAGMSRVFVADEPALGRKVVIKAVAPERMPGVSAERFAREIRFAATLQQANIVPLLAAGSAEGMPYYTMPFVDGRSLRERIEGEGPLPIRDAVSVLRDVARALAYAHARGVVHRDIKPGNVLLSGDTAVVSDFGIATAIGAALGEADLRTTTTRGTGGIGTPGYMAPEQAVGGKGFDQRADIYAFGCLAYAVLTGKPPFGGRAVHEIIMAQLREPAPSLATLRTDVPPSLAALAERCVDPDPVRRPQTARELLEALDAAAQVVPAPRRSRGRVALAGAMALALLAAGALVVRRGGTAAGASAAEPLALSVVPFLNVAGDTAIDNLADGLGDEVLTAMGKVTGVRITGRAAAYRYRGQSALDAREVERFLGARLLLTGTIRRHGRQVTVAAQLDDSLAHGELWSATFVRDVRNVGALSEEIAGAITSKLRERFAGAIGGERVEPVGTRDSAALDLFLVGNALLKRRGAGVIQSIGYFERAIARDPGFARAHAALAEAVAYHPYFTGVTFASVRDRVRSEASRALALDSTLVQARTVLGLSYYHEMRWPEARVEFERAIRSAPTDAQPHFIFGRALLFSAEPEEALRHLKEARREEQVSAIISAWTAYAYYLRGQADSAATEVARAVQLDSTVLPTANFAAMVSLARGDTSLARRLTAVAPPPGVMSTAPYVLARLGDTATAWRRVRAMENATPRPWFTAPAEATVWLAVGDTARALSALERAARRTGPIWILYVPVRDPVYDPIRKSPRFAALIRAVGLPETVITAPRGVRR